MRVTHDTIAEVEPLDNPVWHALTGPHAHFAEGTDLALRYPPDVAVFAGMPFDPNVEAWDALGALVGTKGVAGVVQAMRLTPPPGWREIMRLPGLQMVVTEAIGRDDPELITLTSSDVDDMLALIERTRPGPFQRRTIELGTYLGYRDEDGALIAMTGERMHMPGYTEISAVCTDERARKRGLGTRLVRAVAAGIERRDETPMLHVSAENAVAIQLYETLGFKTRGTFEFLIVQAPK